MKSASTEFTFCRWVYILLTVVIFLSLSSCGREFDRALGKKDPVLLEPVLEPVPESVLAPPAPPPALPESPPQKTSCAHYRIVDFVERYTECLPQKKIYDIRFHEEALKITVYKTRWEKEFAEIDLLRFRKASYGAGPEIIKFSCKFSTGYWLPDTQHFRVYACTPLSGKIEFSDEQLDHFRIAYVFDSMRLVKNNCPASVTYKMQTRAVDCKDDDMDPVQVRFTLESAEVGPLYFKEQVD